MLMNTIMIQQKCSERERERVRERERERGGGGGGGRGGGGESTIALDPKILKHL
jgi:hypothetical protein